MTWRWKLLAKQFHSTIHSRLNILVWTIIVKHKNYKCLTIIIIFTVCEMLSNGVSAMFGPSFGDTAPIVQSICDYKEIPHIQTRWDINQKRGSCQINLYPHPSTLSKVSTNNIIIPIINMKNDVSYILYRHSPI